MFAIAFAIIFLYFSFVVVYSHKNTKKPQDIVVFRLELIAGFEPATSSLPRSCPKIGKGKT